MVDYNTAGEQNSFEVIPSDTIAVVQIGIRPGNAGEGGLFKRSKDGGCEGLDVTNTVVDGPHAKRKVFGFWITSGTTEGHATATDITARRLRAILESARGIKPADVSEAAKQARVADYENFDGMRYIAKIGVEPARGDYKAKNFIAEVITPDRKEWHPVEQEAKPAASTAAHAGNVTPIAKPAWAS